MIKNICIYHKNCLDGFGAAMAVYLHHELRGEPIELIPAHYGDEPPSVDETTNVIIVDFSYPRETLETMKIDARSLHVIDHHKTAQKELAGLSYCDFDMTKSGALMAWERYMKPLPVPPVIHAISDRDLWEFKLPDTRAVTAALMLLPYDVETWRPLLGYDIDDYYHLVTKGEAILEYQNSQAEKIAKASDFPFQTIGGYDVPCINTTHLIREIGHAIAADYPFVAMYFDTKDHRIYSLRSAENGLDVSEIAKQYGGGGHQHAAGFKTDKPQHLL